MSDPEHLDTMLTRLKLTAIRERLDTLLDEAARAQMTLRETLAYLCQAEIAHKVFSDNYLDRSMTTILAG
jgi:hypothetical protein